MAKSKDLKKEEARKLRLEGKSVNEISKLLVVSKSSVSLWVRDIPQPEQFTPEVRSKDKRERRKRIEDKKSEITSNRVFLDRDPYIGWQMYKPYLMKKQGRYYVGLKKNGIWKMMALARLRMELKLGRDLREDEQVDHIDENKQNDEIENLQILPPGDNNRKARAHGKGPSILDMARGEDGGQSKFTNVEVENLRKEFLNGNYSIRSFAKKYSIAYPSMSSILRGLTYRNVIMPEGLREFTDKTAKKFSNKYDSDAQLKIKNYLKEGHSSYKISKILNIHPSTVYYIVKKYNLVPSSSLA